MRREGTNVLKRLVGAWRFELQASCAQGRRATRLRYAPAVIALLILRHFLTVLLIFTIVFTADCARMGYCTVTVPMGAASRASADGGECLLLFRRAWVCCSIEGQQFPAGVPGKSPRHTISAEAQFICLGDAQQRNSARASCR